MTQTTLSVSEDESNEIASCGCCGNASRTVWGHVNHGEPIVAAYFVQWTIGRPDHGANFDLILGPWGEESSARDRQAISLVYRNSPEGSEFMVIDADNRPVAQSDLASKALSREEVISTDLAAHTFAILDAIWLQDTRIDEVRSF